MTGPTRREAETRLGIKEKAAAERAQLLTKWRADNPTATCDDATALLLARMSLTYGRRRPAASERRPHCPTCRCLER